MDPRTGETFGPLGDNEAGEELTKEKLREAFERSREEREEAKLAELARATEHVEGGGKLVAVDGAVVQRLRLGDRELARRRQRRR